jgi:hypothetical protein
MMPTTTTLTMTTVVGVIIGGGVMIVRDCATILILLSRGRRCWCATMRFVKGLILVYLLHGHVHVRMSLLRLMYLLALLVLIVRGRGRTSFGIAIIVNSTGFKRAVLVPITNVGTVGHVVGSVVVVDAMTLVP